MAIIFENVTVIGVGLIGGSLVRAIKKNAACQRVTGFTKNQSELDKALELGVIDEIASSIKHAVKNADLIILAVPLGAFQQVLQEIAGNCKPSAVITDVGSAKNSVIDAAKHAFGEIPPNLVPGHPIAGTEKSGVDASFDTLFVNRCTIITPTEQTNDNAIAKVKALWEVVGSNVVLMSASHHDQILAATSHLPHVLAFSLVDTLSQMHEHSEIFQFAAGGFRDFTRIASSDPTMWKDICVHNKDAILSVLKLYEVQLKMLEEAIASQDAEGIESIFQRAKKARDEHVIL